MVTMEEGWSDLSSIALQTIGCKLNQAETESLARKFLKAGYHVVAPEQKSDVYILNTCSVTSTAERKCRTLLRSARRRNPDAFIVAIGCYVDRAPSELQKIPGLDLLVSNKDKEQIVDFISNRALIKRVETGQTVDLKNQLFRTRSFVKIQEGCSHVCSFCIVPRVRGREKSRPRDDIIEEIQNRISEGYKEVILTGTRIGKYNDANLIELVQNILKECSLSRLRLSSLEPPDITPKLLALWNDKRLCPHIHMPLQSGSNSVLEHMGRGYSTNEFQRAALLARKIIPGLSLTTDIMVGFPGESQKEFDESYQFCKNMNFAKLHVFPYSARPGTKAYNMEDHVNDEGKKGRVITMLHLDRVSGERFQRQLLGSDVNVLWEEKKGGIWHGFTDNYVRVLLQGAGSYSNELLKTRIIAFKNDGLYGELVPDEAYFMGIRGA